jgi:hypothetical protein
MGRIKVVKMAIIPKAIYTFNAISVKIPVTFCTEIEKAIMKYIWKHRRPQIAKVILSKKIQCWKYHNTLFQSILQSHNNKNSMILAQKQTGRQWIRIEDPVRNIHIYSQLLFDK